MCGSPPGCRPRSEGASPTLAASPVTHPAARRLASRRPAWAWTCRPSLTTGLGNGRELRPAVAAHLRDSTGRAQGPLVSPGSRPGTARHRCPPVPMVLHGHRMRVCRPPPGRGPPHWGDVVVWVTAGGGRPLPLLPWSDPSASLSRLPALLSCPVTWREPGRLVRKNSFWSTASSPCPSSIPANQRGGVSLAHRPLLQEEPSAPFRGACAHLRVSASVGFFLCFSPPSLQRGGSGTQA